MEILELLKLAIGDSLLVASEEITGSEERAHIKLNIRVGASIAFADIRNLATDLHAACSFGTV